MLTQEVDALIAEENISDANPSVIPDEVPPVETPEEPAAPAVDVPAEVPAEEAPVEKPEPKEEPVEKPVEEPTQVADPTPAPTPSKVKFDEAKMFDEQGNARPFKEVVQVGEYLASQIRPVEVVGKDGQKYQFNTVNDYREQFPDGLELKDGIERARLEKGLVDNDAKFNEAINNLREAEEQYNQYTQETIQTRESQTQIANEYKAMADQGLVPKVGDPNDPKFGESEAVKELNNIMAWMDKTNTENATKGLGKITSLYVAKQLMDGETAKEDKTKKASQIIQERNEVASLSSSPTPDQGKKQQYQNIPMSRLADQIIASENLR